MKVKIITTLKAFKTNFEIIFLILFQIYIKIFKIDLKYFNINLKIYKNLI